MNRGEVWDVDWPGAGRHPVVIVTRQVAIPLLTNVTVALVTSTVRDLPTEVLLDERHGLERESVKDTFEVNLLDQVDLTKVVVTE